MGQENHRNIRLGLFVIAGMLLLIIALYFIGSKQNLFGSSFRLTAKFYNVNGLVEGNNVRFAGIDIGTVESVEIESDTSVHVTLILDKDVQKFIKQNAIVSVGTDGLMGNKLVNIISSKINAPPIKEGDELKAIRTQEMDEMMRTLDITNENVKVITTNLRDITGNIGNKENIGGILFDTVAAKNVRSAIVNLKLMTDQGISVTGNLKSMVEDIRAGKGTIGALITDTAFSGKIKQTIVKLEKFSDTAGVITGNISNLVRQLKDGKGSLGMLLTDTTLVHDLNKSIQRIDTSSLKFNENMDALRYSWPFKKGFRIKAKKK